MSHVSSSIIRGLAINILQLNLQDLDLDTLAAWNWTAHFLIRSGGGKERKITWDSVLFRDMWKMRCEIWARAGDPGDLTEIFFGRFAQENDWEKRTSRFSKIGGHWCWLGPHWNQQSEGCFGEVVGWALLPHVWMFSEARLSKMGWCLCRKGSRLEGYFYSSGWRQVLQGHGWLSSMRDVPSVDGSLSRC